MEDQIDEQLKLVEDWVTDKFLDSQQKDPLHPSAVNLGKRNALYANLVDTQTFEVLNACNIDKIPLKNEDRQKLEKMKVLKSIRAKIGETTEMNLLLCLDLSTSSANNCSLISLISAEGMLKALSDRKLSRRWYWISQQR